MDKKKMLIPILIGILAVIVLAVLLLSGEETPPAQTPGTAPPVQSQTVPTPTDVPGTTGAETTGPAVGEQTEPAETEPDDEVPEETDPDRDEPIQTEPEQTEPVQTEPPAQPAYLAQLEDGQLTVRNMFQFTGMNPDADNAFGEDIAGIEMTNNSGRHMTVAEVTVIMENGDILTFRAEDIPAGRTVMAFSLEHSSVEDVRGCEEVYGYAEFEGGDLLLMDQVQCTVDGIGITVKNLTNETLTDLEVYCHGLLDSSFFGGTTYCYHVSTLPAGGSTVIYAEECILGVTEVVRVDRGG